MIVTVSASAVSGSIQAPPSKSCSQRALAAALLNPGRTYIENVGDSNDERAALRVIHSLGAEVHQRGKTVEVITDTVVFRKHDRKSGIVVDCGESGLSMRMFSGIASLFNFEITLHGSGSILTRPMNFVSEYLPQLGVRVSSNNHLVPITICGPIRPEEITVDGSLSSQFLTGLLFAYCKSATAPVTLHVSNLTSKPYIDLTISVLKDFGYRIQNNDYRSFTIQPADQNKNNEIHYQVEGDWSNAAFLLVAGVISGSEKGVSLTGLKPESTQGDRAVLNALKKSGAVVSITDHQIDVKKSGPLKAFEFDATQCPDLFPPLVALASQCNGETAIKGVHRLLHKESNRAEALKTEFGKMKVDIDIRDDVMLIRGGSGISGAVVSSHNDHRIAMATAITALYSTKGDTQIQDADAINKSYPGFYDDLKQLGGKVNVNEQRSLDKR